MGRVAIVISKEELKEQIEVAEATHKFDNVSRLCEFLSKTEWAKTIKDALGRPREVSAATFAQRITEFALPIQTQKAKVRAPSKPNPPSSSVSTDRKPPEGLSEQIEFFKKEYPKYVKTFEKMRSPSPAVRNASAIKANCIHCACGELEEVKRCTVYHCAFYHISPLVLGTLHVEPDSEPHQLDSAEPDVDSQADSGTILEDVQEED